MCSSAWNSAIKGIWRRFYSFTHTHQDGILKTRRQEHNSCSTLKTRDSLIISGFVLSLTDPIDIVTDPIPPHEYKAEEDTRLYKSAKTQRGPLRDDWIEEYNNNPGKTPIMCAYKLCKVEFRYWGMQSKIERFIHDVGENALQDVTVLYVRE